jgi:hypothetical protein
MKELHFETACSYSGPKGKKTCMSDETAELIKLGADSVKSIKSSEVDKTLSNGKNLDELNLLLNKDIIGLLGEDKVKEELKNFKPVGPANTTELFNNFVENNVKNHLQGFDSSFKPVSVQLMDFPEEGYTFNDELRDFVKNNIEKIKSGTVKTFGCVLNTLRSKGDLSAVGHWVSLFGDFRSKPYTIEFFNSSGNKAPKRVFNWMEKTASKIEEATGVKTIAVNVSNIVHQKSNTECGAYSLYYITARLAGYPYKKFREKPIRDEVMIRFRKAALNPEDKIKNLKFLQKLYIV